MPGWTSAPTLTWRSPTRPAKGAGGLQRLEPLGGDGLAGLQAAGAVELAPGVVAQRDRLVELGAQRGGVEVHQLLALAHALAFGEADVLDDAGDLGGDGHRVAGAHGAHTLGALDDSAVAGG